MTQESNHRFPKAVRLRKQAEFDRVYQSDHFVADNQLVMRGCRTDGETRLGLSISRKVGNAVVRNQWKRTIREAFRKQRLEMPRGLDLVVRPRKGAKCDYQKVYESLTKLVARLEKRMGPLDQNSKGQHG